LNLLNHPVEDYKIKEAYIVVSLVIGSRKFESHTFSSIELKKDIILNQMTLFKNV
jgi:hypothetical protein